LESLSRALGVAQGSSANLLLEKLSPRIPPAHSPSFSAESLGKFMDGDLHQIKQKVRNLVRDPIFSPKTIIDKDEYRQSVLEKLKILAQRGYGSYSFPEKYGGKDKKGEHMAIFETLAYSDLSLTVKFGVQFGLFGGAIHQLGTERHHSRYLEQIHSGQLLGCFAMTETGHGSNVKSLETTAEFNREKNLIIVHSPGYSAGKEYIGNALHATLAVVFAQLIVDRENQGVHAFVIQIRDEEGNLKEGVTVEDCGYKMGLNGVDNGRIWFHKLEIPTENLLNRFGDLEGGKYQTMIPSSSRRFFTMLGTLVTGRISVGLAAVSAMKKGLAIAISYGLKRRQFGPKESGPETLIIDYPTHQERLFPFVASAYAYSSALDWLAKEHAGPSELDDREIETMAAGLKAKSTWLTTATLQECREACGGKGYLSENEIAALKADTDIFTTFEGDNTVLMQLVAKGLLTSFKESFHEASSRAVIKVIMAKIGFTLRTWNEFEKRNTSSSHLTSPDTIIELLDFRYQKSLISLSQRMRKFIKRRINPYQAFLKSQTHMIDLADAYIDLLVFEKFREKIESCQEENLKDVLTKLLILHGLHNLYENKGWYLENEVMQGVKTKAIRRLKAKLMKELRDEMGELVKAFLIPSSLISAPIAFREYS
jgi:acyl-CoA oxidase